MSTSIGIKHSRKIPTQKNQGFRVPGFLRGWQQTEKVHHYQLSNNGIDFAFEHCTEDHREYLMTAQCFGVKSNDLIKIRDASSCNTYKVLEIDYYTDPADMWTARLLIVSE